MTLFDLPIWQNLSAFAHLSKGGRDNLDLLRLPDDLRVLALSAIANCVACGDPIHPLRARVKSKRSNIAGTETERRLFYAATCPAEKNAGCARSRSAKEHKKWIRRMFSAQIAIKAQEPDQIRNLIEGWRKSAQAHTMFDSAASIAIAQTLLSCAKQLEAVCVPQARLEDQNGRERSHEAGVSD